MELRTRIFAPKRFDDPARHHDPEEVLRRRRIRSPDTTPYRTVKPVEYNPNLPSAAFPTVDYSLPREVGAATESLFSEGNPPEILSPVPTIPCANPSEVRQPNNTPRRRRFRRSQSRFSLGSSDDALEADEGLRSNGPENSVYERNMKLLGKMQKRMDSDWIEAEMATSSEDEESVSAVQQAQTMIECPTWDELPIPNQVDLINVLSDRCDGEQTAMSKLRLNSAEKEKMNEILARQQQSLADEDLRIEALQAVTNRIIMADNSTKARHMSQAKYREVVGKHLYISDEENLYISTKAGLSKAKQYLQSCGYKPELLDHWTKGSYVADGDDMEDIENTQVPLLESVAEQQEAAQSTPAVQSRESGGSSTKDLVGQQPFRTSTESATMPPSANTSRAPQTSNPQNAHSSVAGGIEKSGESSAANCDNTSVGVLEQRRRRRLNRRRTHTTRLPRRQIVPRPSPIGQALAIPSPLRSELPQNSASFSTPNTVAPLANMIPSTQTSFSPNPMLITSARLEPATTDPPSRKKTLQLQVSQPSVEMSSSKANNNREPPEVSPHSKPARRPKMPAMLASLKSCPGFKSELPESSSPRGSRRTTADASPLKPRSEVKEKAKK